MGRSAVLCAGLLVVAARFGLPIVLYEIGSSAGLNLMLDRYRYQFGEVRWGDPAAALRLAPDWEGPPPPVDAPLKIASRAGVDMAPIDVTQPEQSARLLAYVWADQAARLARLTTALQMAVTRPPIITADDAAVWLPRRLRLAARGQRGKVRVLMHSLVWGYLTAEVKDRIERHMNACALRATYDAPLAWLSFEIEPEQRWVVLRLRIWPDGSNTVLAHARAHGDAVKWLLA